MRPPAVHPLDDDISMQMRRQEEQMKSMNAAIEGGYLRAPEVVALCHVSCLECKA